MNQRMNYLVYIMANLRNKPGRNLATVFCFFFIAANIFCGQILFAGATGSVGQGISRMGADIIVIPPAYMPYLQGVGPNNTVAIVRSEATMYRFNLGAMEKIRVVEGIHAMSPQLFVSTMNMPKLSSKPVDIFGIDPQTDFTIQPWLHKPLIHPLAPGEIILGHDLAGTVSSKISISGQVYTIVGKLDPTESRIDHTIFLRMDDAYILATAKNIVLASDPQISNGDVNAILIRVAPGEDPDKIVDNIKRIFPYYYLTAFARHFSLDPVAQEIKGLPYLLNLISVVIIVAAFPLIGLIAAMAAHEREREIGLLRTMGAKRKTIIFLVMSESLLLAAIGGFIGVGISLVAIILLSATGTLDTILQVSTLFPAPFEIGLMAGVALLCVIAIGSLASLYPAYRSGIMNPYDAIRREGN
jgi:putative ABC transport system permease protein